MRASIVVLIACLLAVSAQAKYGGGSGTKEDPYQIWTAEQLNVIGTERADWNKHFKLMADIDLSELGEVPFNVIGIRPIYGRPFSGVFDGDGKTIANLTCTKSSAMSLGLFGGVQGTAALIQNLLLEGPVVDAGTGGFVGALVGDLQGGKISRCYVEGGSISGRSFVGGLVGSCNGVVVNCSSSANVSASNSSGGGLIGRNESGGAITSSYAAGQVSAGSRAGGFAAENAGAISDCYSMSETSATNDSAGGLVASGSGTIRNCYSTGSVSTPVTAGGLLAAITGNGAVTDSFWDAQTSGQSTSAGGSGMSTAQMRTAATFPAWDFADTWTIQEGLDYPRLQWEANPFPVSVPTTAEKVSGDFQCAPAGSKLAFPLTVRVKDQDGQAMANMQVEFTVTASDGMVEPVSVVTDIGGCASAELTLDLTPGLNQVEVVVGSLSASFSAAGLAQGYGGGSGTADDPYQIRTAQQMHVIGTEPNDWDKHFMLMADIDLSRLYGVEGPWIFNMIAPGEGFGDGDFQGAPFTGVFDGNDHVVSHVTIMASGYSGVFGQLAAGAEVKNLGIVDFNVGFGGLAGALVGKNWGKVTHCYSTGVVGGWRSGGLVGRNYGDVTQCYAACAVSGDDYTGGLVGENDGLVSECYSTGKVTGMFFGIGGLVGFNIGGTVTQCYSTGAASGKEMVGGLVGWNSWGGAVSYSYSTGTPTGDSQIGGLVGNNTGTVTQGFWDTQTSGRVSSAGGIGRTTAQMKTAGTFANWDFAGTWIIDEGMDYPGLRMQGKYGGGSGTADDPYQIWTAEQMNAIGASPADWDKHFKLMVDIDLSGFDGRDGRPAFNLLAPVDGGLGAYLWATPFSGTFDGNGHTISHLTITGENYLALFGYLDSSAEVKDLGLVDVNVTAQGSYVGALVGYSFARVSHCYSTGVVTGASVQVGGLIGYNRGPLTQCYSAAVTTGDWIVGGLVGENLGTVTACYSTGAVTAVGSFGDVGGLLGGNWSTLTQCYSTSKVSGIGSVGGLVGVRFGRGGGAATDCFWDTETSGQATSAGGTGKTTAEMQTASTFLDAMWDLADETANGTEDIWRILEGKDYPHLWWEATEE